MKGGPLSSPFWVRKPAATAAALLALATLALFNRFLLPWTQTLLSLPHEDLAGQFVWWRQFGFEELRKGHLALWDPYLFCGAPFFGGFQSALLYPSNWLFMVFPPPFAVNFSVAFHVFLGGWFTYLWLKARESHEASAYLGAFAFMFGSSYFLHIVPGHLPNLCTMVWIPFLLYVADRYRMEGRLQWILAGMAGLALQIFAGHIQYVYYTVVFLIFYVLFHPPALPRKKTRYWAGWALIGIGAGLLAAVQLLGGWDAVQESSRGQGLPIGFLNTADITPERLWCLLMPGFFGGWKDYWGGGFYWEGAVFISMTGFALALFGLWASGQPQKKFFGLMALGLTLVAVGLRTPLFALFCSTFPLFNRFRGVGKLNILITLCLIALAAMGLDLFFKKAESLRGFAKGTLWGASVFLLASAVFFAAPRMGGQGLFKQYAGHADSMSASLLGCGLLLGILAALALGAMKRPALKWGFLLIGLVELFFYAGANLPSFDWQDLQKKVEPLQKIYQEDPGDYRVFTDGFNYALGVRGWSAWGDDPVIPWRYETFADLTQSLKADYKRFNHPLKNYPKALSLTRLKYAFYEKDGGLVKQKLDLPALPRAFLVGQWEAAPLEKIWPRLLEAGFDPRTKAWLEEDPGIPLRPGKPEGQVSLKDLTTDEIEIQADLGQPALLLFSDNFSKGWTLKPLSEDGHPPARILPANGFQMAIPLEAGKHHFELRYLPRLFVIGKWVSLIAWPVFLLLCIFRKRLFPYQTDL